MSLNFDALTKPDEIKHIEVSTDGLSVMIGMPTTRSIHALTVRSIVRTMKHCNDIAIPYDLGMIIGSAVITKARDEVIDIFLESKFNRLFWIDSDMVWETSDFIRMLALSKIHPVICGAYTAKKDTPTFYVNHNEFVKNEVGLIPINGIGLGFTVMDRKIVEELSERAPRIKDQVTEKTYASIFRTDTHDGNFRGEDMAFFSDIKDLGHEVLLDPEIKLGHIGEKVFTGSILDAFN